MRYRRSGRGALVEFLRAAEDEAQALEFVRGVGGVVFGDGVGGAQGFGFVDGSHVLCEGVGAGEGSVAFWDMLEMNFISCCG